MSTENIVIKTTETGARQVARNIESIGTSAAKSQNQVASMLKTLAQVNVAATMLKNAESQAAKMAATLFRLDAANGKAALTQQKLATETARTQLMMAKVEAQLNRNNVAQDRATASAARLSAQQSRAAAASSQAAAAADRAAITSLKLASAQDRAAVSASRHAGTLDGLKNSLMALGAALSLRQVLEYADSWIQAEGKVNIFTHSATETTMVMDRLYEIAQKTRQPIDGIAGSFHQLSIAGSALGASQNELLQFTQAVGNAFAIQGTDSNTARGGIIQLGQAMNEGIVRAQEYNSMINAMPIVLKTVANNLDGAGGSLAKLRKMMLDGKLTSRDFFNALLKGQGELAALFERSGKTFGQAFTVMENGLKRYIGELNKSTGASRAFYDVAVVVANNIGNIVNALIALAAPRIVGGLVNITRQLWLMAAAAAANPYATIGAAIIAVTTALVLFKDQLVVTQVGLEDCTVASVTLGDYMSAAWDIGKEGAVELAGYLTTEFVAAWGLVKEDWKGAGPIFDQVVSTVALNVNTMIGTFVGFGKSIGIVLNGIPAAFKDTMVQAGNGMISALESTINKAIELSNTMRAKVGLDAFSMVAIDRIDNPNAGKAAELGSQVKTAFTESLNVDYIGVATEAVANTVGGVLDDLNARALASAKERQRIAAEEKKLQDEINLDAKNGTGENFAGNTKQSAAQKKAEKAAESLRKYIAEQKASTDAANGMATAYLAGSDAVSAMTRQQEIETQVSKRGEIARKAVTEAVNAHHDALERLDIAKAVNDTKIETADMIAQTAVLRANIASVQQGKAAQDAYNVSKAMTAIMAGKNSAAYDEERKKLEAQTKALNDARNEYEAVSEIAGLVDSTATAQEKYNKQLEHFKSLEAYAKTPEELEAIRRAIVEAQNATSIWAQLTEGAVDRIDSSFADMWKNVFDGTKSTLDGMKDAMKQWLAEMAHMLLTKPLMVSIGNTLLGTNKSGGITEVLGQVFGGGGGGGGGIETAWNAVSGAYSAATSGFGSAVGAGWAGGQGLIGGIQGAFSSGASYISNAISGAFSSGAAAATGAAGNVGYGLGQSLVSGGVGSSGAAAGAGASYASSAAGAGLSATGALMYGIGGAIQGYLQAGVKGAVAGAGGAVAGAYAGAAIGSAVPVIGTAIGAAIGAVLGGMFGSSLFGGDWVTKDQGLQLGVTGGELDANNYEYQKKKGGLFSSNKKRTRITALDPEMQTALDTAYATTMGTVLGLFDTLNVELSDGVLDGLNIASTKISTKGKTAEEVQKEVSDWFVALGNAAVTAISDATNSGLGGYSVDQLSEFVGNLFAINDTFKLLNINALPVSVWGGKLAEQFIAMSGGMEKFNENAKAYYSNFFTETEQADDVLKSVTDQFKALGITMPTSRAGFRAMVEAIDSTTDAGRAMYINLIGLNQNAAAAYTILEQRAADAEQALLDLAEAERKLKMEAVGNAQSALQRAADAQKDILLNAFNKQNDALNNSLTSAQTAVSNLTSMSNALDSALKKMTGQSDEATKVIYKQGLATLQSAVAIARAGGSLSNFEGLSDALDAVTSNDTTGYTDWENFARDQGIATNLISELNDKTGDQLSTQEKVVKRLEDQIKALKDNYDLQVKGIEDQVAFAQSQIDALNGIDTSVKSVTDAVKAMNTAVVAAIASMPGNAATAGPKTNGTLIESTYKELLGRSADTKGMEYWQQQLASGALNYGNLVEAIRNAAAANGSLLPGKAMGGYATGLNIVGEMGPEIVDMSRGYVHTASDSRALLSNSNDEVVSVLEQILEKLTRIDHDNHNTALEVPAQGRALKDIRDALLESETA